MKDSRGISPSGRRPSSSLLFPGLDGANPLGYLAALGLFRVLSGKSSLRPVRMGWIRSGGTWVPELSLENNPSLDQSELLKLLIESLPSSIHDHPAQLLEDLGRARGDQERRAIFLDSLKENSPVHLDWLAAIASDFAPPESINQLQTVRRDYFFGNLTSVIESTTTDHLRRSIFHSWDYADPLDNQSVHLDPSEDRRHAYQWNKPAGDPDRKKSGGMIGANRLAIEAIPLFTSLPEAGTLRTVGFTGNRSHNTRWTWPIWGPKVTLQEASSLLLISIAQQEKIGPADREILRARGIVGLYRTKRILVGKTPNFTPAERIA